MVKQPHLKVHFVGIGGMGMCGIAEVLINLGYDVTGSDIAETEITRHLVSIGGKVFVGHRSENLGDADVVVVSSAVKQYNPEIEAAKARHIPVIRRAEMLGELMRLKQAVAVAGAHGKTTTTTMISSVLMSAGLDPTAVIGGRVNGLGLANARLGKSKYLVAEADESDGSFLSLLPTLAVVTNIDAEHLDHYKTVGAIHDAFVHFVNRLPFYGLAVLCQDDPGVQAVLPRIEKRYVTYGLAANATYRARNIRFEELKTKFVVWRKAEELGEIELPMPGQHNVLNALAVVAICEFLEIPFEQTAAGLASFQGIQRRFTIRGEVGGVTVVDDFAHHPTEVRATLSGARAGYAGRRIIAAFQPHRYTRTRDQMQEFAHSFFDADKVIVCDVFPAGEPPIEGVNSSTLVRSIQEQGHKDVEYVAKREEVAQALAKHARPGDVIITLGAGNIQLTCNELITQLEATRGEAKLKNLVRI